MDLADLNRIFNHGEFYHDGYSPPIALVDDLEHPWFVLATTYLCCLFRGEASSPVLLDISDDRRSLVKGKLDAIYRRNLDVTALQIDAHPQAVFFTPLLDAIVLEYLL